MIYIYSVRNMSFSNYFMLVTFQEPVKYEDDIVKFCEETGLPVALDETINSHRENPLQFLQKYSHSGVAAVVSRSIFIENLFQTTQFMDASH